MIKTNLLTNNKLKEGMLVLVSDGGQKEFIGMVGYTTDDRVFIFQNKHNGSTPSSTVGYKKYKDSGFKFSWAVSRGNNNVKIKKANMTMTQYLNKTNIQDINH